MRRRLLNLLTALSLLLCMAVAALWVRSHFGSDEFAYRRGGNVKVIRSYGGRVDLFVSRFASIPPGWSWQAGRQDLAEMEFQEWADTRVKLPHAAVVAAAGTLPALRLITRRTRGVWRLAHSMLCVSLLVLCIMVGVAQDPSDEQIGAVYFIGALSLAIALFCVRDLVAAGAMEAGKPPPWRLLARRDWLRRSGRCLRCGYDLRATPGRCPECGTAATTPA